MTGDRLLTTRPPADWDRLGRAGTKIHPVHCHRQLASPPRPVSARALGSPLCGGADGSEDGTEDPVPGQVCPSPASLPFLNQGLIPAHWQLES